jgi:hypothetical protein
MTDTITVSCTVDTTDPAAELGFEAWVDDQKFFDLDHVQAQQPVVVEIADDDDGEHELRFVLKNKTSDHTQIDAAGNIVADARLIVTDLAFDEIKLGHMVTEQSTYTHDFNGTGQLTQDKFYGAMGCNGTVSLKFSTPVYMWLLEHM